MIDDYRFECTTLPPCVSASKHAIGDKAPFDVLRNCAVTVGDRVVSRCIHTERTVCFRAMKANFETSAVCNPRTQK